MDKSRIIQKKRKFKNTQLQTIRLRKKERHSITYIHLQFNSFMNYLFNTNARGVRL